MTRDTDYALRALCFIAGCKGKIVSVSKLVRVLKVPQPFLRKLLQILSKKGILKSYKGNSGGFLLNNDPGNIFLVDLIKIFQGPFILNECFLKKHPCPNIKRCILRKKITRIEEYVLKKLKGITVSCLLKGD